jgi:two-component system response regulator NreC
MEVSASAGDVAAASVQSVRVLVVDDSSDFLVWAIRFLCLDARIKVVGSATSGFDAIEQVALLHPDVVLMDVSLPDMTGLQVTRQIKALPDPPCVIISTLYDNPEYRAAAEDVHADGFITKSEFGTGMLPMIHKLCGYRLGS